MAERMDKVRACFDSEGADAARALAHSLAVSKPRIDRWLAAWGGDAPSEPPTTTKPTARSGGGVDRYQAMIMHYEAIAKYKRKHPDQRHLPDDLSDLEDEIMALCAERDWVYPGKLDVN